MSIKPLKKVSGVKRANVTLDDILQTAGVKEARPAPEGKPGDFNLVGRQLHYQGQAVGELIKKTATQNPQFLSLLAQELEKFREESTQKKKTRFFKFKKTTTDAYSDEELSLIHGLCDAYILKIGELVRQRYDQTQDGFNVTFDENQQLILNGLNIHAIVERCRENPEQKSLLFLKGIRDRLMIVLQNKSANKNYERLKEVIDGLCGEIDSLIGS